MNSYENSKKARRIASVAYLAIMAVIMTGTYLSQKQKAATPQELRLSDETPNVDSTLRIEVTH